MFESMNSSYLVLWGVGDLVGFVAALFVLRARGALGVATVTALLLAWAGLVFGSKWHYRLENMSVLDALLMSPTEVITAGNRLPLGLLVGGVLAGLWCLAVGASWRATGDALAVAASTLIPIGRIGCLMNGCCMGVACGPWAPAFLCVRQPPGTEAYNEQLGHHLIESGSSLSLAAHPLPVYFALSSLVVLAVMLWLLRHGTRPGALLAVFMIVRPLTKLAVEPLRAYPRPPALMLGVPALELAVALLALALVFGRRRAARRTGAVERDRRAGSHA